MESVPKHQKHKRFLVFYIDKMPSIEIIEVNTHTRIGILKYHSLNPSYEDSHSDLSHILALIPASYHPRRKAEIFYTHHLLHVMTGICPKQLISHDDNGKPLFNDYSLSISHTKGIITVIISTKEVVAIDIEYVSDRINKVFNRIRRMDETADSLTEKLLIWCAKETAFKYFSDSYINATDFKVKLDLRRYPDKLTCLNTLNQKLLKIKAIYNNDYVMTYLHV